MIKEMDMSKVVDAILDGSVTIETQWNDITRVLRCNLSERGIYFATLLDDDAILAVRARDGVREMIKEKYLKHD